MTDNQKKLIQIYREKGMSYKAIADALSVSINTIKTFCKRNGLEKISQNPTKSLALVDECDTQS